jgi:hypothetical protein
VENTAFANIVQHIDQTYGTNIIETNSVSKSILREYFKWNYYDYSKNSIITEISKQQYSFEVYSVNFKLLYSFDSFIDLIEKIIHHFLIPYKIDNDSIIWYFSLWSNFIKNIKAIKWNTYAYEVYHAILNNQNIDINFNILQEAWLNARLELVYNKEMPFEQEVYFKNTQEIIEYLNEI